MRAFSLVGLGLFTLASPQSAGAQALRSPSLQVELGLAFREVPKQSFAASDGTQGLGRVLIPLRSELRAFGEVTLSRFATRSAAVPVPVACPVGTLCPQQLAVAAGPRILSLSVGLLRRLHINPVIVQLSGFGGRSWLSGQEAGSARSTFSLGAAAGLLFPGSGHVRPMLEARAVRLLAGDSHPTWVGGVAVGVAID